MSLALAVKSNDLFDELGNEKRQTPNRRLKVRSKTQLDKILTAYEEFLSELREEPWDDTDYVLRDQKVESVSKEELFEFLSALRTHRRVDEYGDYDSLAGNFASSLINMHAGTKLSLDTDNLEFLSYLGARTKGKRLVIQGDVDDSLGWDMQSGTLYLYGNAGRDVGRYLVKGKIFVSGNVGDCVGSEAIGGTTIIRGNAGNRVGEQMFGGKVVVYGDVGDNVGERNGYSDRESDGAGSIYIFGNAGKNIGEKMHGGAIHLFGDYESISDNLVSGKVYHKGKLIVNNWRERDTWNY